MAGMDTPDDSAREGAEGGAAVIVGYAFGVGICSVATLGVFLQYSQGWLDAATASLLSFAVGAVLGGAWAAWRRVHLE